MKVIVYILFGIFSTQGFAAEKKNIYQTKVWIENVPNTVKQVLMAEAIYPFEREAVWNVLTNYPRFKGITRELKVVKVEKHEGVESIVFARIDLPWKFSDITNRVKITEHLTEGFIEWKMLEGNLKANDGVATLVPVEKGIKLILKSDLRAGARFPQFFIFREAKKMVPKILTRLGHKISAENRKILTARDKLRNSQAPSTELKLPL